jgi:hypothetical protein
VRVFQSRRSLLIWKIFGERLDGWKNEDFVTETVPGDPKSLELAGKPATPKDGAYHIGYRGSVMPPPEAVAGNYVGPNGKPIKVPALSADDRLTLVRWIDLGCPLDLEYQPDQPAAANKGGWLTDESRPTLTVTQPEPNHNTRFTRILIGMYDYGSGLDLASLRVTADFALDGMAAGTNLGDKFTVIAPGVWEYVLRQPVTQLPEQRVSVSIKDLQGNETQVERDFTVSAK